MTTIGPDDSCYHRDPSLDALYRSSAAEALSAYRRTVSDESTSSSLSSSVVQQPRPGQQEVDYHRGAIAAASSAPATVSDSEDSASRRLSNGTGDVPAAPPPTSSASDAKKSTTNKEPRHHPLEGITRPGPNDVLCGRGHGANNHPGNIRFRNLLKYSKLRYVAAWKAEKPRVAREVVDVWRAMDPPGRFLIKSSNQPSAGDVNGTKGGPTNAAVKTSYARSSVWHDVGDKRAREKTSQTLRERNADLLARLAETVNGAGGMNGDERRRQVLEAVRRTHRPPELGPQGIESLSKELDKCSANNAELTREEIARAATTALQSLGLTVPQQQQQHARPAPQVEPRATQPPLGTAVVYPSGRSAVSMPATPSPKRKPQESPLDRNDSPRGLDLLAVVAGAGEGLTRSPRQQRVPPSPQALQHVRPHRAYSVEEHRHQHQNYPQVPTLPPFKRRRTEPHSLAPEHAGNGFDSHGATAGSTLLASHNCHRQGEVHRPLLCDPPPVPRECASSLECKLGAPYGATPRDAPGNRGEHDMELAATVQDEIQRLRRQQRDLLVRRASLGVAAQQQLTQQRTRRGQLMVLDEAVAAQRRASNVGFGGHYTSAPVAGTGAAMGGAPLLPNMNTYHHDHRRRTEADDACGMYATASASDYHHY